MIKSYEYRVYPRKWEIEKLDQMLWQGRLVYNQALEVCISTYKETGKGIKAINQWSYFRDWRKQEGILLNASSLQHILRRLDKSYAAFFRRIKAGETPGHPRFKGRGRFNSLEYTYGDGIKLSFDKVLNRPFLYIQNIGDLKIKLHRPIPAGAVIKYAIIKRKASGWYVCFQLNTPDVVPSIHTGPAVAGDVGLMHLLTLSDGSVIENPRWLRASLIDLNRAQRRLSRRKKGSKRREKARKQVALLHEHIANIRKDFWHKTTSNLINTYSAIAIEDLSPKFMIQNHGLALSASDAGLGIFHTLLDCKAEKAGVEIVRVNPAYTSQVCSDCGNLVGKSLSIRMHMCPHCGLIIDRDLNAARNIYQVAFNSAWIGPSGVNVRQ